MQSQNDNDAAKARARLLFREEQKADAPKALAEYQAGLQAVRERTNRLRQERLAREAKT